MILPSNINRTSLVLKFPGNDAGGDEGDASCFFIFLWSLLTRPWGARKDVAERTSPQSLGDVRGRDCSCSVPDQVYKV